jgi:hypothetical protein
MRGETGRMSLSRRSVGRFLAEAVTSHAYVQESVALSGAVPVPQRALASGR